MPPALVAGGIATVILLATYLATAAPDLTYWDASELVTAAHTLGIPHPPGTPLWVLMGHVATMLFSAAGPVRAVTMLSVVAGALTGGIGAAMASRWIGARGAVAGAVMAGTMWSVWNNATETEVYAVALLFSVLMLAAGEYAGRDGISDAQRGRGRALIVFIAGLAVPLHLSVLVVLPAAVALAWNGRRPRLADIGAWCALFLLGLSALAVLPLLSARAPWLDSGHPVTLQAMMELVQRKQYAVSSLWPRAAPFWLQLGNVLEWADWQVAYGVHPTPPPSVVRTALTLCWVWLAVLGLRFTWRRDVRVGRALALLLVCGTFGVATWLNMRAGPSFGVGVLPEGAQHEARERDYFLVAGFWIWGLLAGAGLTALARSLARRLPPLVASLPFALAAVPLIANRPAADRTVEPLATLARTTARLTLEAVPQNGVLFTAGDNDSFPLWYLQQVEQLRIDVDIVTVPMLGAKWYRERLVTRERLLPEAVANRWQGLAATLGGAAEQVRAQGRPLRVSVLLSATDRRLLNPTAGWLLEGLVYAPSHALSPGVVSLDTRAMARSAGAVPASALRRLPKSADAAAVHMQQLLRCAGIRELTDTLLVRTCNGG